MLVIISDIHLGDGTTAKSISPAAFHLFTSRLREAAYFASWRTDGRYRPIEEIDVVLLGDVIDPLHSTLWLDTQPSDPDYVRPWTDSANPAYAAKLGQITGAIFEENREAIQTLKSLSTDGIKLAPADHRGKPNSMSLERITPQVRIHYMVGNHDWYYHLSGADFDALRQEIIDGMGLSNTASPFPHKLEESSALQEIFERYKIYGRHGDIFDKFNYDREKGRDFASLGDVLGAEVFNRYPIAVQERLGDELPPALVDSLRRLVNIRPALAAPLWISGQLKQHAGSDELEDELKEVWDDICDEFLQLDVVREADKTFKFDIVDALELIVKISRRTSFTTINDLVVWIREKFWEEELSFAEHALHEPAFLDESARYIVYGHTHQHEIVSLDAKGDIPYPESQVYLNSGTWYSYYDLAIQNPLDQKFIPYQSLTYLTFYKDDERGGQKFEAWSGTYMS